MTDKELNLYLVVSEELTCGGIYSPPGYYTIAELVIARTRSQARYHALKTDRDFTYWSIRDWPKCQVRLKRQGVEGPIRVATDEFQEDSLWEL